MDCNGLVSTVHPGLSIPELIKFIRYTFRQCEFDEVQNTLMEREKKMELEIEELVRDRDSLKKEIDLLENSQSYTELQKCGVEEKLGMSKRRCDELDKVIVRMEEEIRILKHEKLVVEQKLECSNKKCEEMDERLLKMGMSQRRCEELDKEIVQMGEEIRILRREKVVVEEKLECSNRNCLEMDERLLKMGTNQRKCEDLDKEVVQMGEKISILSGKKLVVEKKLQCSIRKCDEMDERLLKMSREIEDLRREKLDANRTVEELKQREIEADRTVQELKRKNAEASQTIDELRVQKMESSDKAAKVYYSRVANLDKSILKFEKRLSKMLSVDVQDFPNLVNGMDDCASMSTDSKEEENGDAVSPEVCATCDNSAGSGGVGLPQKGGINLAHPCLVPAVAESRGTVQNNEGQEPEVKVPTGKTQPSSSAAGSVIVISDSEDEADPADTLPGKSSGQTSKRNRTECGEDSTAKRERSTFAQPSRCRSLPSRREERPCEDSDDEACSDTYMNNLVATLKK